MLCRSSEISIWTLNGDLMVQQDVFVEGDDTITACAFYEGNGNEVLERQLIFTGHKRGVVNVRPSPIPLCWCTTFGILTLRAAGLEHRNTRGRIPARARETDAPHGSSRFQHWSVDHGDLAHGAGCVYRRRRWTSGKEHCPKIVKARN